MAEAKLGSKQMEPPVRPTVGRGMALRPCADVGLRAALEAVERVDEFMDCSAGTVESCIACEGAGEAAKGVPG